MSIIHRVRVLMMENKYLRKWVGPISKIKIVKNRREGILEQRRRKAAIEFKACYEAHKSEFESVAQMLEDDFSRKTLQTLIDYRLDPRGGTEGHSRYATILYA